MICLDREVNYRGAAFKIVIETASEIICKEILGILERGEFSKALELIKSHGGCKLLSENPLKIMSGDGQIRLNLEPINFLAKMSWEIVVDKAKEYCR